MALLSLLVDNTPAVNDPVLLLTLEPELVVPSVPFVYVTVPCALLTFALKSLFVEPAYTVILLTLIGLAAFLVVNDLVVLAAFTVLVLDNDAVIVTDLLLPLTTVITPVLLLIVAPSVLLLE